jgi:poly(hydroxyalkanoate) depolymerase family esterase
MSTQHADLFGTVNATRVHRGHIASIVLLFATVLGAPRPAAAATLQEVQGFGNNPSNEKMYLYVPDKVAVSPPILVAIHYCGGSANAFFTGTGYRALADQYGFIVIYPQTTSSDGCFDVHSDATLHHDAGGDSAGIASMVRYTVSKYAANASRVYVTGTSSGAMMTNVLLGAYPDLFRAGAAFAGVPYACFAGTSGWNSACANGQTTKSAQQWGDLVREGYPGYSGPRPRVQLWHGDQDETLNFHNFGEAIKQWTNVLGVSETPTTTEKNAPQSGWTRTRYADAAGIVRVEAVLEAGMMHNLTVPAAEVVRFFGLDGTADPGGSAAGGGAGGMAGGVGGSSGGSGTGTARGGTAGAAGAGAPAGSVSGAGGRAAGAGTGAAGGAPRPGADAGGGVMSGVGGAMATSGSVVGAAQGGSPVGIAGSASQDRASSSSCSIHTRGARGGGMAAALMMVALGAFLRGRKRSGSRCG